MTTLKMHIIILLLAALNIAGLVTVAADKHKAKKHLWRIPEKTFFLIALLGGCPGVYAGCLIFRHKTKHWRFMLGLPLILAAQLLAVWFAVFRR